MITKTFSALVVGVAALLPVLAGGMLPASAHSTEEPAADPASITWAIQPATDAGPDGRTSLRHSVAGGESVGDIVGVSNFSSVPARFAVYSSVGTITADGSFDLAPPSDDDEGSWVTVEPVDGSTAREGGGIIIDVPAGAVALIPVRIDVPANATPGDHPAGIVAELVREGDDAVTLSTRVGVRVHLRVTGDLVAELVPTAVDTSYAPSWNPFAPGVLTVSYVMANDGNIRLGAQGSVSAGGPFGLAGKTASSEQREILPGEHKQIVTQLEVWPLFMNWGDVEVVPNVVGEDDDVAVDAASTQFVAWTVPWAQLVALAVVIAGVFLFRFTKRRSEARTQARIDAAVAAAVGTPELSSSFGPRKELPPGPTSSD